MSYFFECPSDGHAMHGILTIPEASIIAKRRYMFISGNQGPGITAR